MKGIRILSDFNAKALVELALFGLLAGPILYIFQLAITSIVTHATHFFQPGIVSSLATEREWAKGFVAKKAPTIARAEYTSLRKKIASQLP